MSGIATIPVDRLYPPLPPEMRAELRALLAPIPDVPAPAVQGRRLPMGHVLTLLAERREA